MTAEDDLHYHLFFNDEDLRSYDTNLKVGPPIRTERVNCTYHCVLKDENQTVATRSRTMKIRERATFWNDRTLSVFWCVKQKIM